MTEQASVSQDSPKPDKAAPPGLYSESRAFEIVIPDPTIRPSVRTQARWRAQKLFPYVRVGTKVFVDPEALRRALDRSFTIRAVGQ